MKIISQSSPEWHSARAGRFTSSRIVELMGIKALGKTGETYALEKAIEYFIEPSEDDNYVSFDMHRGIDLEPLAFAKFKEIKEKEFLQVSPGGFIPYGDDTGTTPDGFVSDDAVVEMKCPKKETFFRVVLTGEIDKKYYAQMQHQMYCTGRSKAYYFVYFIQDGEELWHCIEVERDEDFIEKMVTRIAEAVVIRDTFIEQIKNNKQF